MQAGELKGPGVAGREQSALGRQFYSEGAKNPELTVDGRSRQSKGKDVRLDNAQRIPQHPTNCPHAEPRNMVETLPDLLFHNENVN